MWLLASPAILGENCNKPVHRVNIRGNPTRFHTVEGMLVESGRCGEH